MPSISLYDPDEETTPVRPAWQTPKTPLEKRALAACRRKYFQGTTKHTSDYAKFSMLEEWALGATEDAYLQKRWLEFCIEWAEKKNAMGGFISFSALLNFMGNHDAREDWITKNRTRVLEERAGGRELDIDKFLSK